MKKFAQLSDRERQLGLLDDPAAVRRLDGWLRWLRARNLKLEQHKISKY